MNLDNDLVILFYKLFHGMIWGINEKHKIIESFTKPSGGEPLGTSLDLFLKVRDAIWDEPELIDIFLSPDGNCDFSEPERNIITDWRNNFIKGNFIILKHLKKYSVLMRTFDNKTLLYGVHGITDSFEETMLLYPMPTYAKVVLLPFKNRIIYDSFFELSRLTFGPGMKASFNRSYKESKAMYGIIETLSGALPQQIAPDDAPSKKRRPR